MGLWEGLQIPSTAVFYCVVLIQKDAKRKKKKKKNSNMTMCNQADSHYRQSNNCYNGR